LRLSGHDRVADAVELRINSSIKPATSGAARDATALGHGWIFHQFDVLSKGKPRE